MTKSTDQPLRSLSAAAYMSDAGQLFVYGGIGNGGYNDLLKDAFVYNGKEWKKMDKDLQWRSLQIRYAKE